MSTRLDFRFGVMKQRDSKSKIWEGSHHVYKIVWLYLLKLLYILAVKSRKRQILPVRVSLFGNPLRDLLDVMCKFEHLHRFNDSAESWC